MMHLSRCNHCRHRARPVPTSTRHQCWRLVFSIANHNLAHCLFYRETAAYVLVEITRTACTTFAPAPAQRSPAPRASFPCETPNTLAISFRSVTTGYLLCKHLYLLCTWPTADFWLLASVAWRAPSAREQKSRPQSWKWRIQLKKKLNRAFRSRITPRKITHKKRHWRASSCWGIWSCIEGRGVSR